MDLGVRQFDPDLGVVPHRLDSVVEPLLRVGQLCRVHDAVLARRLLGGALAGAHDDLRFALALLHLLSVALAPRQFDLGLGEFALLAVHIGLGDPHHAFGGLLFHGERLLVRREVPAVPGDRPVPQVGDLVDPFQEFPVVADDDQDTVPGVDRRVETAARVQIQVVRRFVQQQHVRPGQQQRRQAQQHALAARHLADRAIEPDVAEAELVERGERTLLHVPVVTDRGEPFLADVARLDGVQRRTDPGDAQGGVDAQRGVQDQVLRQVADLTRRPDVTLDGREFARDQPQQGRLARAVEPDESGAAGPHGEMEVVEDRAAVGPGEGERRAGDVGEGGRHEESPGCEEGQGQRGETPVTGFPPENPEVVRKALVAEDGSKS